MLGHCLSGPKATKASSQHEKEEVGPHKTVPRFGRLDVELA